MTQEEAWELFIPYFNRIVVQPNGCHYVKGLSNKPIGNIKINNKWKPMILSRLAMFAEGKLTEEQIYLDKF